MMREINGALDAFVRMGGDEKNITLVRGRKGL